MHYWKFKMLYLSGFVVLAVSLMCSVEHVTGKCIPSKCGSRSTCILSEDGHSCKCAAGYFGDQCDQAVTINVVCGKDSITVFVTEDFFKYYNVGLGSVHLANPECRARKEVIADVAFYTVRTSKEKYRFCGGKPVEKNLTHVVYSLVMMSTQQAYANIVRDPAIKIEYICVYPFIRTLSLGFPVRSASRETVSRIDELDADVELSLYRDGRYVDVFVGVPTVHFGERVFMQVSVTRPIDFFNLRVDECWATQTPNPNDTESLSHTLLLDGCADDESVSFITKSITYRNEPYHLYLHCLVHLCTQEHGESCVPECHNVVKREAPLKEPQESLVSYGPIRLELPDQPKMNMLFTLMFPLAVVWILTLFLLVLISIAKAGNRHRAYDCPS